MAKYHGKGGRVYMAGSTGAAINLLACYEWSLDLSKDRVDATTFDDGNIVEVPGFSKVSGKLSVYWDDTNDTLWQAVESNSAVNMYIYPTRSVAGKYWEGPAWVDASISGSVKDMVKVDLTFSAGGTWVRH